MENDIFDLLGTQSTTPEIGTLRTQGTKKLLVVVLIVDCSTSMKEGGRIGAVNAALKELLYQLTEIKNSNNIEIKIAVMSFAANVKWEVPLTPVEEVVLDPISLRAGYTTYGAVFRELNKVLSDNRFMKHTGKVSPPAIVFLTDGEPADEYDRYLDELLRNIYFAGASRGAVLIGDSFYNDAAQEAVRKFVSKDKKGEYNISNADNSTTIIRKIELATMKAINEPPQKANKEEDNLSAPDCLANIVSASNDTKPIVVSENDAGDDTIMGQSVGDKAMRGTDTKADNNSQVNNPFEGVFDTPPFDVDLGENI